jgi:hypothetical protein
VFSQATLCNQSFFDAITELYQASYGSYTSGSGSRGKAGPETSLPELWEHPFGHFDAKKAIAHVDRIGYRLPEAISVPDIGGGDDVGTVGGGVAGGAGGGSGTSKRGKKRRGLQRSLTPHMDCCPTALHAGGGKQYPRWR